MRNKTIRTHKLLGKKCKCGKKTRGKPVCSLCKKINARKIRRPRICKRCGGGTKGTKQYCASCRRIVKAEIQKKYRKIYYIEKIKPLNLKN